MAQSRSKKSKAPETTKATENVKEVEQVTENGASTEVAAPDTLAQDAQNAPQNDEQPTGGTDTHDTDADAAEGDVGGQDDASQAEAGSETEQESAEDTAKRVHKAIVSGTHNVAAPEGRILKEDEEVTFDGQEIGGFVVVKEDVYREFYPHNSKRPSYSLVYAKGSAIPVETLQKNK